MWGEEDGGRKEGKEREWEKGRFRFWLLERSSPYLPCLPLVQEGLGTPLVPTGGGIQTLLHKRSLTITPSGASMPSLPWSPLGPWTTQELGHMDMAETGSSHHRSCGS